MVKTVGLINPGAMGTPVGVAAKLSGARVVWMAAGRSEASMSRAAQAGFEPLSSTADFVSAADLIISVCPPHAAPTVASDVVGHGFGGIYIDANAISPESVHAIDELVRAAGASFVDGSIIGGPPKRRGTTRLYLSGKRAVAAGEAFAQGHFDVVVMGEHVGEASAIKMAFAAWTKGSDALLLAIRALARAHGVEQALLHEWAQSMPGLTESSIAAVSGSAPKAWRFVGEMNQIAATFAAKDLPDGFHRAAADVYARLDEFKNSDAPDLDSVLSALTSENS